MVCSIRKWLPIPGGGVLHFNKNICDVGGQAKVKSTDNGRSYGMVLKDIFLTTGFNRNKGKR